jgi:uncharacterized protein (DUF3084 family)
MPFLSIAWAILTNKYILMGIMITAVVIGLYEKGRMDAQHKFELAAKEAQIALMVRDRDLAAKAAADAAQRAEKLSADVAQREQEIADYAQELAARPDRCDLTPADLNRLRGKPGKGK